MPKRCGSMRNKQTGQEAISMSSCCVMTTCKDAVDVDDVVPLTVVSVLAKRNCVKRRILRIASVVPAASCFIVQEFVTSKRLVMAAMGEWDKSSRTTSAAADAASFCLSRSDKMALMQKFSAMNGCILESRASESLCWSQVATRENSGCASCCACVLCCICSKEESTRFGGTKTAANRGGSRDRLDSFNETRKE